MKEKKGRPKRTAIWVVYGLLFAGILWQSYGAFKFLVPFSSEPSHTATVAGNVKKPGVYRISAGSTYFELLRTAGMTPHSDISSLDLLSMVEPGAIVRVAAVDQPMMLKSSNGARLEFYFGDLSIIRPDGSVRPGYRGASIGEGERVVTESQSQAEFSFNSFSRVDMSEFAEVSFDRINASEGERTLTEVFQKAGTCWYKLAYTEPQQLFRIVTPGAVISIMGSGSDFMIRMEKDITIVHALSGDVLVERIGSSESLRMAMGQSATIFADGRPLQVSGLSLEVSPGELFSRLAQERTIPEQKRNVFNFLFCGVPAAYFLINVDFDRAHVNMVHIPANTEVDLFVMNASTLDQVMLSGGADMTSTVIENLMDVVVPKYIVVDRERLIRIASILGGIPVVVTGQDAAALGVRSGKQLLTGDQLAFYLRPSDLRSEGGRDRQMKVLSGIFEQMSTRNLVINTITAQQLVGGSETNFSASEMVSHYQAFSARTGWTFGTHSLPGTLVRHGQGNRLQPDITQCRALIVRDD